MKKEKVTMSNEEAMLRLVSLAEHEGEEVLIYAEDAKASQMGIDAIKALEEQTKTGYWIVNKEKSLARCSNCKFLLKNKDEIKLFGTFIQGYNYCPYCGAKMVEPQESKTKQGLAYADQDTLMSAT